MQFEWDDSKSTENEKKHGINFVDAIAMFYDESGIDIPSTVSDEPRYLKIALVGNKLWTSVYTIRFEKIRIISVRRSRKEERTLYG